MEFDIEKRVLHKISWRIMPFIMLLYFIVYINRVNIDFAALTMKADLGYTASIPGFGVGIFFWGYFLFEVPSNIVLYKIGVRIWIARVMVTQGIIPAAMAFAQGATNFYITRFLLGAAEAESFPGIALYLNYWFLVRHRVGVTISLMAAVPLSTVLGLPIFAALLEIQGVMGLAGWQRMFILKAIPAFILGVVALFYMTDRPEQASWLREDERAWLIKVMYEESGSNTASVNHSILRGLADLRVIVLVLIYFGTSASLYTLGIWAPQIAKQLSMSSMRVGLLNATLSTVSVVAMVFWSHHPDRSGERTWHIVTACVAAAVGLVMIGSASGVIGLIVALMLVNAGISCAKPPLWSMPMMFLSEAAAATGVATINSIGNLGGFFGPATIGWIKDRTGSFAGGLYFVVGLLMFSVVLTLVLSSTQKSKAIVAQAVAHRNGFHVGPPTRLVVLAVVELFALVTDALSLVSDGAPVTCANTAPLPRAANIATTTQSARAEDGVRCIMFLS